VAAVAEHDKVLVLDADGTPLPYRRFEAKGRPRGSLVYLHGIQSHGGWYTETAAALAERGYTVYLPDRRGSGASPEPRGHFDSPEQLVEDALRFVELAREDGAPVFLAGGCWGARPAIACALENGRAGLAGLVLVCPALKAHVDLTPRQKARVALRRGNVPVPLAPELFTRNEERVEFIRRDPVGLHEVTAEFFFNQARWDRRLRATTGLDLPLLLLQAGDDPIVDREWVREWFTRLDSPDRTYVLYPESGHILDFEPDPSQYLDDLATWLDARTAPRRSRAPVTVARVDVLTVDLPFRFSFGHALAARKESTNVVVRLALSDGTVGHGEGVPRDYVTGETVEGAVEALRVRLVPALLGRDAEDPAGAMATVPFEGPDGLDHAARCALELALLDACGRREGRSVQDYLGGGRVPFVRYDAVIPFSSPRKLTAMALAIRALGIRQVKIKVGADLDHDLAVLARLRKLLGPDVDIRVDANCAWNLDEALRTIECMREFAISSVEQPLPPEEGLAEVTRLVPEVVIADESLRTVAEAEELAAANGCDAFNIRVSKCGGLLPSLEIARIAARAGLVCVVGAQVGESGILSAAGRHLAAAIAPRYVEGSGGSLLLKQDLTEESVVPGRRGLARPHTGPGLGVTVDESVLARYGRPADA
jgi:muconate cycloisomerase